jgi:hypothetical protein
MMKKIKIQIIFILILGAGCFFLTSISAKENTGKTKEIAKTNTVNKDSLFRLKKFSYVDRQGIGGEAFSLLIPSDWDFQGGITWRLDNPGMPAVAQFTVKNP